MNVRARWLVVFSLFLGAFGCTSSSHHDGGDGGSGGSGGAFTTSGPATVGTGGASSSVATTSSSSSGQTASSSDAATTGTGGGCAMGGQPCQAFSDCCSGTCANQICTSCAGQGQSCAIGCCLGLTCNANQCGTCLADGSSCVNASDCCSNICQVGTCAAAKPCSKCADFISGTGDPNNVCPGSQAAFDALFACACNGPCAAQCGNNVCAGGSPDAACQACVQNSCPSQLNNCFSN